MKRCRDCTKRVVAQQTGSQPLFKQVEWLTTLERPEMMKNVRKEKQMYNACKFDGGGTILSIIYVEAKRRMCLGFACGKNQRRGIVGREVLQGPFLIGD
jgi:hypothetical protein